MKTRVKKSLWLTGMATTGASVVAVVSCGNEKLAKQKKANIIII